MTATTPTPRPPSTQAFAIGAQREYYTTLRQIDLLARRNAYAAANAMIASRMNYWIDRHMTNCLIDEFHAWQAVKARQAQRKEEAR